MLTSHEPRSSREELVRVIRQVRNRWRLKLALRGVAVMVAAGIVAFLMSAYGLEYFRFSAPAIIAFRVLTYVILTAMFVRSLVLPLARRVSDERVALYLEEHEPSLQAAVVSALEESGKPNMIGRADLSPALIRQLIAVAVEKCRTIDSGRGVERRACSARPAFWPAWPRSHQRPDEHRRQDHVGEHAEGDDRRRAEAEVLETVGRQQERDDPGGHHHGDTPQREFSRQRLRT